MPTAIQNPGNLPPHLAARCRLVNMDNAHNKPRSKAAAKIATALAHDVIEYRKAHKRRIGFTRKMLNKAFPLHTLEPFREPDYIFPPDPNTMSPAEYRRAKEAYEHYNAFATRHPLIAAMLVFAAMIVVWQFI